MASGLRDERIEEPAEDPWSAELRPVIAESVRTRVLPLEPLVLVDKIHVAARIIDDRRVEAYRLWLSDGDRAIQALLKSHIHPFVNSGEIREGSYVRLLQYELTRSKNLSGKGFTTLLIISNFRAVGYDGRLLGEVKVEEPLRQDSRPGSRKGNRSAESVFDPGDLLRKFENAEKRSSSQGDQPRNPGEDLDLFRDPRPSMPNAEGARPAEEPAPQERDSPSLVEAGKKRKLEESPSPLESVDPNGSRRTVKAPRLEGERQAQEGRPRSSDGPPKESTEQSAPTIRSTAPALLSIRRPLQISPLSAVTGPNARRNRLVDVLVVIWSVAPTTIRRTGVPEHRILAVTDASTRKKVSLSMFVDPQDFIPAVGTIALLRNISTHEWDGGCLKAYESYCRGKRWYIPEPAEVPPSQLQILRDLWNNRRKEEEDFQNILKEESKKAKNLRPPPGRPDCSRSSS